MRHMQQHGFSEHYFLSDDGLRLYARRYGDAPPIATAQLPIVCLPGLSRNSRDFHSLALFLSSPEGGSRTVACLDYRGRGQSARDPDKSRYTLPVEANDVITGCRALGIEKAIFIGTSRGGLILHLLAQQMPSLIGAAVLNDIGPVIELEGLLAIRDYLNSGIAPKTWEDAPAHLRALHGAEFPALGAKDWIEMATAIYRDENGHPVADFDTAIATPLLSLNRETSLPHLWEAFQALGERPLLLIRGENSRLLTKSTATEMQRRHERMKSVTAPGQGHAPMLHLDGAREDIVRFLDKAAGDA